MAKRRLLSSWVLLVISCAAGLVSCRSNTSIQPTAHAKPAGPTPVVSWPTPYANLRSPMPTWPSPHEHWMRGITDIPAFATIDPCRPEPLLTPVATPDRERAFAPPFELSPSNSGPAEIGLWYPFALGHCGVRSPLDFDGSYWMPIGVTDWCADGDPANWSTGRAGLVYRDTLEYQTPCGFRARFRRHDSNMWPWMCM